jgi:four helix bundle protein
MATFKQFEDLAVWILSRDLAKRFGKLILDGRLKNNFRLINQIHGSLGSIMDNIAEGFERGNNKEFIVFLGYAKASCGEFRSQLYRSLDWEYLNESEFNEYVKEAKRISSSIFNFSSYLAKSEIAGIRKKNK